MVFAGTGSGPVAYVVVSAVFMEFAGSAMEKWGDFPGHPRLKEGAATPLLFRESYQDEWW